jgi:hypothetical protein
MSGRCWSQQRCGELVRLGRQPRVSERGFKRKSWLRSCPAALPGSTAHAAGTVVAAALDGVATLHPHPLERRVHLQHVTGSVVRTSCPFVSAAFVLASTSKTCFFRYLPDSRVMVSEYKRPWKRWRTAGQRPPRQGAAISHQ